MNQFPKDFNGNLTGVGGDPGMNQAQHRAAIKNTPIILVHGQGTNATDSKWGWEPMKGFLKKVGYNACELWAMDYLGEDNNQVDMPTPHTKRINEFRIFIDRVITYLGVKRVDFIAHSLGCGMVNAYLRGLQSDGTWKDEEGRFEKLGTFVALAGGTYGLGQGSMGEFQTGSPFEVRSHKYKVTTDDTPFGADSPSKQVGDCDKQVTSLDNDEVKYVAIIAVGDFVDSQNKDTSRREGAHLCKRFNLGSGLAGHEKVIKDQTVFDAFKGYLNKYPPGPPPPEIRVDKASGNYGSNLQITISVEPANTAVDYRAERLTKAAFEAGYIRKYVTETRSGTLAHGQSITLAPDGAWEVTCSAAGAAPVVCTYGVNIVLPIATILTPNDKPFEDSLTVEASTTKGILYHSLDAEHWVAGANVSITDIATVSFIAIDADGLASPLVSRPYEPVIPVSVKATLTEHLIAGRLTLDQYLALGRELGFTAVVTLYLIHGKWVYDPHKPERGVAAPTGLLAIALAARGVKPREEQLVITADKDPHREYPEGFEVRLSASDPNGNPVPVYYTEDGSDPADARNPNRHRFVGSESFTISGKGNHAIFCYARDSSGNERFEPFTWSIQEKPK